MHRALTLICYLYLFGVANCVIRFQPELYTCVQKHCLNSLCTATKNTCEEDEFLTNSNCRHCESGFFGVDCRAFSPQCMFSEHGFEDWCVPKYRAASLCTTDCKSCSITEPFLDSNGVYQFGEVGCYSGGQCFHSEAIAVHGNWEEQRPIRVCAYGFGAAAIKQTEEFENVWMYECVPCIDGMVACGDRAATCQHNNWAKCSCEKDDYESQVVPDEKSCTDRCPSDRWGANCAEQCFCSEQALCDSKTGVCSCPSSNPACRLCRSGREGPKCETGCSAVCLDIKEVKCSREFCYRETTISHERVCPFGYGSKKHGKVSELGKTFDGYECVPCFHGMEIRPTCNVIGNYAMCQEKDYTVCSCATHDYRAAVPGGCRVCPIDKWGPKCEHECHCGPDAVCNLLTGECTCPRDSKNKASECQRCKAARSGKNCDEECTGNCSVGVSRYCKANLCYTTRLDVRACPYGFGHKVNKTKLSPLRGVQCRPCFEVEPHESSEVCAAGVTCAGYNSSRCSCDDADYAQSAPANCRRCLNATYGPFCEHKCTCGPEAICDVDNGDCSCAVAGACHLCPGEKVIRKVAVAAGKFAHWCMDSEELPDIYVDAEYVEWKALLLELTLGPPTLALVLSIIGCVIDVYSWRKRISSIYKQHKKRIDSLEEMVEQGFEERTVTSEMLNVSKSAEPSVQSKIQ